MLCWNNKSLFGGLLACGLCGGSVIAISATHYGCAAPKDRGASVCRGLYVSRKATNDRLLSVVREDLLSPRAWTDLQRDIAVAIADRQRAPTKEEKQTRERMLNLNREIENLVQAVA